MEEVYLSFKVTPDEEKLIQIAARLKGISSKEYLKQKMLGIAAKEVLDTSKTLEEDEANELSLLVENTSPKM